MKQYAPPSLVAWTALPAEEVVRLLLASSSQSSLFSLAFAAFAWPFGLHSSHRPSVFVRFAFLPSSLCSLAFTSGVKWIIEHNQPSCAPDYAALCSPALPSLFGLSGLCLFCTDHGYWPSRDEASMCLGWATKASFTERTLPFLRVIQVMRFLG